MAAWQFGALAMFGYDLIVADPPWDFENYSDAGTKKGADPHYGVMPLEAIKALPVHELNQPVKIPLRRSAVATVDLISA